MSLVMKKEKRLCDLAVGDCGRVCALRATGALRRRFLDVGFYIGASVLCVGKSPMKNPRAYMIGGMEVAIRQKDAEEIIIE